MICQKKHWKVRRHRAECAVLAAAAVIPVLGESAEGDVADTTEGSRRDEANYRPLVGAACGGDGGRRKKGELL